MNFRTSADSGDTIPNSGPQFYDIGGEGSAAGIATDHSILGSWSKPPLRAPLHNRPPTVYDPATLLPRTHTLTLARY